MPVSDSELDHDDGDESKSSVKAKYGSVQEFTNQSNEAKFAVPRELLKVLGF